MKKPPLHESTKARTLFLAIGVALLVLAAANSTSLQFHYQQF